MVIFRDELRTKLSEDPASNNDYNYFQNILREVLNKHSPQKKKYLRANDSSFMTKHLRKMIMNRSRSKNAFLKNKTVENWEKYRILRNKCVKETNRARREYFENINIRSVTDNKQFWKTIKPNFSNKNKTQKIILVEKGEIISGNIETAEVFNDYFVNIVKDLNIPEISVISSMNSSIIINDPIETIVQNLKNIQVLLK